MKIIIAILAITDTFFVLILCKIFSKSDKRAEEIFSKMDNNKEKGC